MNRIDPRFAALSVGLILVAACDRAAPTEPRSPEAPSTLDAAITLAPSVERAHEAEFHRLSRAIAGYGGHYFDEAGNLVVHMTDQAEAGRARQFLEPLLGARALSAREAGRASNGAVMVRQAEFTFPQLAQWRDRVTDPVLASPGVEYTDLDEVQNRLVIGVSTNDARQLTAGVLRHHGVPATAVLFRETEPVVLHQSLRDRRRPLEGGFQIVAPGVCTYGFNAVQGGIPVAVTAAHCFDPARTQVHQPTPFEADLISVSGVVSGEYSHVGLIRILASVPRNYGHIARTTGYATGAGNAGSIAIDPLQPRMRIVGTLQFPYVGDELDKIGRTTGWTYGRVSATCIDVSLGAGRTVRCQDLVAGMFGAAGDSGAPVFRWHGPTVTLGGMYWGQLGGQAVMSAIWNIQLDYGPMSTF